jgi:ethanolamine utilization protein EutN
MMLGKVTATLVSTVKHQAYAGRKILVVRPMDPDGTLRPGSVVAVDTVGAGEGDVVLVASEGRAAMEILGYDRRVPLRSVIVGIVDSIQPGSKEQA